MKQIILTKQNAHRAETVRSVYGEVKFNYNAIQVSGSNFVSTIGDGSCCVYEEDFKNYEIVNYKHSVLLEEFDELARRAFNWTSFTPDEKGIITIKGHEERLNADIKDMPNEEKERYIASYKKYFSAWLTACSNCASSAITGGAGFNVRKAEAANKREYDRSKEFTEWRKKALEAIAKRVENNKPKEVKRAKGWELLKLKLISSATTIHEINLGTNRCSSKPLFVSSIFNKVETYAKRGDIEMVQNAIDYIRNFNATKSIVITERHKFFNLVEIAKSVQVKQEETSNKESADTSFIGGVVVHNYAENRIQLLFDEKPSPDIISQLKKNAFKWSPRFGAWQRQLTNNAVHTTREFLRVNNLVKIDE